MGTEFAPRQGLVQHRQALPCSVAGQLVYPRLDVRSIIGREKMKESRFYRDILQEGREEGREEGRQEALRQALLDALRIQFGEDATAPFEAAVNTIEDTDELRRL